MDILKEIRQELKENIEKEYKNNVQRFFTEKVICCGVRVPIVRKIAKKYFKQIKHFDKKQIFDLANDLFKSNYNEEATIAVALITEYSTILEKSDFKIFENWLNRYIDNWSKVDDFCLNLIFPIMDKYPELIEKVKKWSYSENAWVRRASAVSFITTKNSSYITKHKLKDIFEIAEVLLIDKEDLVQKGYGWMLKATSIHSQKEVFDFVMKHKKIMPRTALRYAIEKMPVNLKKQAML